MWYDFYSASYLEYMMSINTYGDTNFDYSAKEVFNRNWSEVTIFPIVTMYFERNILRLCKYFAA